MSTQNNTSEQNQQSTWGVYEALREPRTETEANPPEEMNYDQACVALSVTVSDSLFGVIRHTESEYDFSSKSQSAQRLLRIGLQEIKSEEKGEISEEDLQQLDAYRNVVRKFVTSVGEPKFGFGLLREEQELAVDYGWDTKNRAESFSVFWNQMETIRRYKDQLRVSNSDIFQWGIINATVRLGEEGLIDVPEAERAKSVQEAISQSVTDRLQFTRDAALLSISRAYDSKNHDRVADYCQRTVPDLWEEFKQNTYANHKSLEDNEFLYGIDT